jgi:hypothetical protein
MFEQRLSYSGPDTGGRKVLVSAVGKATPPPPPPPPAPPPPPPPPGEGAAGAAAGGGGICPDALCTKGKSGLNDKCGKYRDGPTAKMLASCMAADCVQSLEGGGKFGNCRFTDPKGFCYAAAAAQKFCEGEAVRRHSFFADSRAVMLYLCISHYHGPGLYLLINFSAALALMINLVCRVRVPGSEHCKLVLQRWQVQRKHGMAAASEGASLLWGRGNCRHLQLPVHEELRVSSVSSLPLSKHCAFSFFLHGLLRSMLTGLWWIFVCCETRCTKDKCWCTDGPEQKRSPEAGTEFADQIKKGILKAGKNGLCSCSCGGELS